jgi:hypothetical protein
MVITKTELRKHLVKARFSGERYTPALKPAFSIGFAVVPKPLMRILTMSFFLDPSHPYLTFASPRASLVAFICLSKASNLH